MTPYYVGNGVTLYLADALEVLPDLPRSGFLLTDPPYGVDQKTDSTTRSSGVYGPESMNVRLGRNRVGERAYNPSPRKKLDHAKIVGDDRPFDPAP